MLRWESSVKIVSWNVNGIRAVLRKEVFLPFVADHKPDVICLQETKAWPEQVALDLPSHSHQYWSRAVRKGYSGTAIFQKPPRYPYTWAWMSSAMIKKVG